MELEDDFVRRFIVELRCYARFILPTLLIYAVESRASLKLWHAVRQLPHLEKEVKPGDHESNVDEAHSRRVRSTREAIKKEARKTRLQQAILPMMLLVIFMFDQYVTLSGWLNRSKDGEDFDGYIGNDAEEYFDGQSGNGYGWYYLTKFGQIDWVELYYPALLFLPATVILARFIGLTSGLKEKVVFRDAKGGKSFIIVTIALVFISAITALFALIQPGSRFVSRRPLFAYLSVTLVSVLLALSALWIRNTVSLIILFASMIHCTVSNPYSGKAVSFKNFIISGLFLLVILVIFLNALLSSSTSDDIKPFSFKIIQSVSHDAGDINWSGLIISALVCTTLFHYIAACYRLDHALARPDEMLVGKPDVKFTPRGSAYSEDDTILDVYGTRWSYCGHLRLGHRRLRWPKPYFHVSLLSWLAAFVLIALGKVQGYIDCDAETVNLFAMYVAPPFTSIGILICALARGEVGKVWGYKEDWLGEPNLEGADVANVAPDAAAEAMQEKPLIQIHDEKTDLPV